MTIAIRRKGALPGHGSEDVVARLADCHAKIRAFLAEARALAMGEGAPDARRASAIAVGRYFAEGLPLHAEDEDRSISPHLPGSARDLARTLAADHQRIEADLQTLAPDWQRWAAGDASPASAGHRRVVLRVSAELEEHLVLEEAQLFPILSSLPASSSRQIVAEMIARRTR